MRKKHVFGKVLAVLALSAALAVPACALEVPDLDATGSISLTMSYEGEAVGGGEITVCKVADPAEDDGNYSWELTNGFEGCGIEPGDLTDTTLAAKYKKYLLDENTDAETLLMEIGADGTVTVSDQTTGLYLIYQADGQAADGYKEMRAFLVSIPFREDEDSAWVYNVNATPKMDTLQTDTETETESESETPTETETKSPQTETPAPQTEPKKPDNNLAQTGQLNWPIPVLAAAGLLVFLLGWYLKRQKENHEG